MPQLDPSGFGTQIFWLALSFIGLYVLLARLVLPRIGATLSARDTHIASTLDAAEAEQQKAESALKAYEDALAQARGNALQVAQTMRDAVQAELDQQRQDLDRKLAQDLALAETQMRNAQTQAESHLRMAANALTIDIVDAIGGIKPSSEAVEKVLPHA